VIVDDGSRDGTLALARELEDRFPGRIRVFQHGDGGNHGPGASRNLGVRKSRGRYVCFLDSDDVVLPNRFEVAVPILDGDPAVDGVAEGFLVQEREGGLARESVGESILSKVAPVPEVRWNVDTILLRRECFLEAGGFSEQLRTCEDLVLWAKLLLSSRIVGGGAEPVALYRRHEENTDLVLQNSLLAYLEVLRWTRGRDIAPGKIAALREVAWGKTLFVCDRLARQGRRGLAMRMLRSAAQAKPGFLLRAAFWKNLLRALGSRAGVSRPRERSG
jgi:glycosyltransferase involved in cell wall biosynthesis